MPPPPTDPIVQARNYLLTEWQDLLATTLACADRVAAAWDSPATDRETVAVPLRVALADSGVLSDYPDALAGTVDAAGYELQANPVAAPPYVAVTSTGPVLRATVADGRLVVRIRCFAVARGPTRYVRADAIPAEALAVTLR